MSSLSANEVLKTRRSVRIFKPEALERSVLEEIVDCARFAPTARNIQPWEFIVVTDKDILKKISSSTDNGRFIEHAAACIAVFSQDTKYFLEDGCSATVYLLLAAHNLGLGGCWIAGDKKPYGPEIAKVLGLPKGHVLISLVALGRPAGEAHMPPKRPLGEVLHWEGFRSI